jgi:DNA polymerase-3 subunit delta'
MDYLIADTLPWFATQQERLRGALGAGRLSHAFLMLAPPGLGADSLAEWLAALVLCEGPQPRPCGGCASCRLMSADNHPDLHVVRVEEDAQQIKVEQIRDLIAELAFKSYRGGYKVGLMLDADLMNTSGANALLKTLEEPAPNTLLVMVSRPTHRLPVTIASRCSRLALRPPDSGVAEAWLAQRAPKRSWAAALQLAGGAPLRALALGEQGMAELDADMTAALAQLAADKVDVTLLAERWIKSEPALRLAWLENWITRRVRAALAEGDSRQSAEPVRLNGALLKAKIRAQFELLDAAREFRRLATTSMNQQLALEALLVNGRAAITG